MFFVKTFPLLVIFAVIGAMAETHTVHFINRCGKGTPTLVRAGQILSQGEDYISPGPFTSVIAYLQTGNCLLNGEQCTTIETTLVNPDPSRPGSGSSTDISLIPPHEFSITSGFTYFHGCDGKGATCDSPNCLTAFYKFDDNGAQVACQENDVNLQITFC